MNSRCFSPVCSYSEIAFSSNFLALLLERGVHADAERVRQFEFVFFTHVIHRRHAKARVPSDDDVHLRPPLPQPSPQVPQVIIDTQEAGRRAMA